MAKQRKLEKQAEEEEKIKMKLVFDILGIASLTKMHIDSLCVPGHENYKEAELEHLSYETKDLHTVITDLHKQVNAVVPLLLTEVNQRIYVGLHLCDLLHQDLCQEYAKRGGK